MSSRSIKSKLFLLLALMGAIPFIVAIIFIGWRSVDHMEKHVKTDAWAKNLTINDHLNQITEKNLFVLRTLAGAPIVKQYLENPTPQNEAIVRPLLGNTNEIFQDNNAIILTDSTGMQLIRTDNLPKVNISHRKHFQEAMVGHDYVSDMMVSIANGEMVLVAVSPVFNDQHQVIGLVQRNFFLNKLQKFVKTQGNEALSVIIVDRQNKIVAQTNDEGSYSTGRDLSEECRLISEALDWGEGVIRMNLNGEDCVITLSRDRLTEWGIITVTPYHFIWNSVHDAVSGGALLGLFIMLFVNLIAYLLANRITRPLREISQVADDLASGKADIEKLNHYSDDELGRISKAINEAYSISEGLRKDSQMDKLTGLYNHYSVEEICRHKLREYEEAAAPGLLAIYLVDLDHFQKANRDEGRQHGDKILKEFAAGLRKAFPNGECIGRLEADEFVVVLDNQQDADTIRKKAQLIKETAHSVTLNGQQVGLTVSIGVAIAPHNGKTYNHLFHAADLALYDAKEKGRDRYSLADDLEG
ncbi:MAG: GGDEF domain-containing protein [Selenomonas sp.]|nr:GGDEF domain-containing protein [Selenomonas sp.]